MKDLMAQHVDTRAPLNIRIRCLLQDFVSPVSVEIDQLDSLLEAFRAVLQQYDDEDANLIAGMVSSFVSQQNGRFDPFAIAELETIGEQVITEVHVKSVQDRSFAELVHMEAHKVFMSTGRVLFGDESPVL